MAVDRKIQPDGTEPPEDPEGHRIGKGAGIYPDLPVGKVLHQHDEQHDNAGPATGFEPSER